MSTRGAQVDRNRNCVLSDRELQFARAILTGSYHCIGRDRYDLRFCVESYFRHAGDVDQVPCVEPARQQDLTIGEDFLYLHQGRIGRHLDELRSRRQRFALGCR